MASKLSDTARSQRDYSDSWSADRSRYPWPYGCIMAEHGCVKPLSCLQTMSWHRSMLGYRHFAASEQHTHHAAQCIASGRAN